MQSTRSGRWIPNTSFSWYENWILYSVVWWCDIIEPRHDKANKVTVRPANAQDRPGRAPSLIRVFAVRVKKLGSLASHWAHSEDSDQTERMPRLICLRWAHSHFVGFVMRRLELMHKTYNFSTLCEYSGEMLSLRTCKYKTGRTGFVLIVIIGQVRRVYKSITVEICQFLARPLHDYYV